MKIQASVRTSSKVAEAIGLLIMLLFVWLLWPHLPLEINKKTVSFFLVVLLVIFNIYDIINTFLLRVVVSQDGVEAHGIRQKGLRYEDLKEVTFYRRSIELKSNKGPSLTLTRKLDEFDACRQAVYDAATAHPKVTIEGNLKALQKLKR